MRISTLSIALMLIVPFFAFAQDYSKMRGSEICSQRSQNISIPSVVKSPGSPVHSYDVLDYNLDMDLFHCYSSPYPKNFDATNIITFRVDSTLSTITLHAVNSSITVNYVGGAGVSFTHVNDELVITLNETYYPGSITQVLINYSHNNVSDNAFNVGNGFVFTDNEPQGARRWFPCYDEPSDKATLTLRAKVPVSVKLGSNGRLADSTIVADSIWYTWISADPIATYLMVVTSKVNYKLDIVYHVDPDNPNDSLPIRFYYNSGENPNAMKEMILPLTDYYESKFGPHPFEKNGFATLNPMFQWGGMENQTLTSLCQSCWMSSLIAHEYAHQWFGDMITCATWADLWLNEGFATYIEALWTGELEGYNAYVDEIEGNANYYMIYNPGWPISSPEWATNPPSNNVLFNYAVTYMKGSCVLYMYRNVVGDSLFFQSIYDYATDTVNFKYKSATIPDFIDKMNESTGMDLTYFFEQWLYQANHPVYHNTYDIIELPDNKWEIKFNIKQTQTNTGFFKMPVDIRVRFAGFADTIVSVMNDFNDQNYSFIFDEQPMSVHFDPYNKIVLKQATLVLSSAAVLSNTTESLKINGNPVNSTARLIFESNSANDIDIHILSLDGKIVSTINKIPVVRGTNEIKLDLSNLVNGTYIINLNAGENIFSNKIILVR